MPKTSMAGTQSAWENLLAGVDANRADLPHLEGYSTQLDTQLKDLKAELVRRSALQAEVLRSTRTITELLKSGRDLASRIAYALRAQYGHDGDKLVEFGVKPTRQHKPVRNGPDLRKEERGAPWIPTATVK